MLIHIQVQQLPTLRAQTKTSYIAYLISWHSRFGSSLLCSAVVSYDVTRFEFGSNKY